MDPPSAPIRVDRNNPDFGPARDGCFLMRWLSLYTFLPFFRSALRPLRKYDLANLSPDIHPADNHQEYERKKHAASPDDRHNVIKLLLRKTLLFDLILSGFLAVLVAALSFTGPLVIERIMKFLNDENATPKQQQEAYMYAGLWIGLYLMRIFIDAYCQRRRTFLSTKAQQILTIEILEKIIILAPSYRLDNQRSRSELYSMLTEDVSRVSSFLGSSSTLFTGPATLIGVQVFLFLQVGVYGLVLVALLIAAGFVQFLLWKKIKEVKKIKKELMERRVLCNQQMFYSIESIKLMGWERLIVDRNLRYREQENILNRRYYNYQNIFDLVVNFVPVLTVFIIFLLLLLFNEDIELNTTLVYTVLSFVGLIFGPLKSLLKAIAGALDGLNALREIRKFLDYREISNFRIQDNSLETGTLIINNLVAAWEPYTKSCKDHQNDLLNPLKQAQPKEQLKVPLMADNINQSEHKLWEDESGITYAEVRQSLKFALGLPMRIDLKRGERLVLVSRPKAGKTTFFQTIIGNLYILSGEVRFGGRIGYMPQKLWFKKESIKNNILFGLPYDKKKLDFVYKMVMLKRELKNLPKGDQTLMVSASGLTQGQQRQVGLARVLYAEPDLMLFDEIFAGIDAETAYFIYNNICDHYQNTTIVLSTHITHFVKKDDRLMILKEGVVHACGTLSQLEEMASHEVPKVVPMTTKDEEKLKLDQLQMKKQRMDLLRSKLRAFVRNIVSLTKGMTREQIEENIFKEAQRRKERKLQAKKASHRMKSMDPVNYRRYILLAPISMHILLLVLSIAIQALQSFSDWWIGSVNSLPWPLNQTQALGVYIGLTAALGMLLAFMGLLSPILSSKAASKLTEQLCESIAYANFNWHAETSSLNVAALANHDDVEIFQITASVYSLFRDSLAFLATIALVVISSPIFLVIAVGAILIDIVIFFNYARATSECDAFFSEYYDPLIQTYDELINGIDLLRAFGKLTNPKNSIVPQLYNFTTYKINRKYIDICMSLVTEIVSLTIIAGAAFFAVESKFNESAQNLAIIGASISFSMKITGLVGGLSWSVQAVKGGIRNTIAQAYSIIGKEQQVGYELPIPPEGWPKDSSVSFDKVTLSYPNAMKAAVNSISFDIAGGENIFFAGKNGGGKEAVFHAMTKQLLPVRNIDLSIGSIKIGGVDLKLVGRKSLTERLTVLKSIPYMATTTLRENVDPFRLYSDQQIKDSLELVGAWEFLGAKSQSLAEHQQEHNIEECLNQVIANAGQYMSLGLLQQINIARAVLSRPQILLWNTAASSLDEVSELKVVKALTKALPRTTILVISQKLTTATRTDKVVYMSNGRIKEYDRPRVLLRKKESNPFRKMVDESESAYRVINILDAMDQET